MLPGNITLVEEGKSWLNDTAGMPFRTNSPLGTGMKPRLILFLRQEWLQLLLMLLPLAAALAAMPFATDRVPMQWGPDGRVNWEAPKSWGLLVLPLLAVVIFGVFFLLEQADPRRIGADGRLTPHGQAIRGIRLALSVVLAAVMMIQISAALGHRPDAGRWVGTLVALLLAVIGCFLGKLKPNRYAGIRIPWTMKSEVVWEETHRFAGWIYTVSGLLMAMALWVLPARAQPALWVVWITLLIVPPIIAAGRAARRERVLQLGGPAPGRGLD
jgi:uncharacterized membrane protein